MSSVSVAAVDLGASSGRVMVGRAGADELSLTEASRFANTPVEVRGTLHWDALALFRGVLDGLRRAGRLEPGLASIGIDSWAVDFGLLDADGHLLGNPVHHRDRRTEGVEAAVLDLVPAQELYETTGLQQLPINTLYQLVAAAGSAQLRAAATLLMIPDLLTYWLTGEIGAEATNASTTQLYDIRTRTWARDLMRRVGVPDRIFPELRGPGDVAGRLLPRVVEQTRVTGPVPVTSVGSHDTASAVVGVPARGDRFAYVSCGTWSLVGLELDAPVLSEASRLANFTNEGGVDGRIRYLRNVMGLWLLQESVRAWESDGSTIDLDAVLRDAAGVLPAFGALIDPDDLAFLPPGDMPARIAEVCRRTGQTPPAGPAETTRCILDSLAVAYRRTLRHAQDLSGHAADVVHIVGGGVRNGLLCQLTADACGLPVLAGPVEAASFGNVLVQARALGAVGGELEDLRGLIARTQQVRRYEPAGDPSAWASAERRAFGD
ncbi:MAG TPA: rhamnulokinase family protein [Nocardioidaceae bacterium]|nr:rhamnulokinase family protein [Nocardioidaceae bacterium]